MKKTDIEPTSATHQETAVATEISTEQQLAALFNQGWGHLMNQRWKKAEAIFAKIEAHNSHYAQNGVQASALRRKAQFERIANSALNSGELEAALIAFKKADDMEQVKEVHHLLSIQELEAKAEQATANGCYQEAAWVYDHLLEAYPQHEKGINWQIKKESCWEAELLPFFLLGVDALETEQWRKAYKAFAQILVADPYFRHNGRSAAALSEMALKELVLLADQLLRQGKVTKALDIYREVGHLARVENVEEFLRLRQHEEETAEQLEAEGSWQEAATKYSYLATLYYDEEARLRWHEAVIRCQQNDKLSNWYQRGIAAFNKQQWGEAAQLFGKIMDLQPDYQPDETPVRKLYRAARWRSIAKQFTSKNNIPPPHLGTGNLS